MTRAPCIEKLASVIAAVRRNHPTRIRIDGVDGAGKTTLADELVVPLARTGRQTIRASVDGFHNPKEFRYRRGVDSPDGYYLDTFDYAALRSQLLEPLSPGGTRRYRRAVFDHRTDRAVDAGEETAASDAILLVDGVFLQRSELADVWDICIWVDAPFDVTVPRAVSRDRARGDVSTDLETKYERRYVRGQLMYIERCDPTRRADIIVYNEDVSRPRLAFRDLV